MSKNIAAILRSVELAKQQRIQRAKTTAPVPVEPVDEDAESWARLNQFYDDYETFDIPDCKGVTPGLVPVSRAAEPKSIHSPAGQSRIKFERPRKRRSPDRAAGPDCELPEDRRRHHTLTTTDGHAIRINPFSKRITVTGPRFR
jgi:hypothetical protein